MQKQLLLASLLLQAFVAVCSARDEDHVLFGAARRGIVGIVSMAAESCHARMTLSPRHNDVLNPAVVTVVHASCAALSLWMERRRWRGSSLSYCASRIRKHTKTMDQSV